jgi:hypothetical protein
LFGQQFSSLARQSGYCVFTAAEAILKGLLEADPGVGLLSGPPVGAFAGLFHAAAEPAAARLLLAHGTKVVPAPNAARGVTLALQAGLSGHRAVAAVPDQDLGAAMPALVQAAAATLADGAGVCVVLEDDPPACPAACPRRACIGLGLACIEPSTVRELRDSLEQALRLSRAARRPVGVVFHRSLLRGFDTMEARPNRVREPGDALPPRPLRRWPRVPETGGLLRVARRLELNRTYSGPSPGERAPCGFLAVGPAGAALSHVIHVTTLYGRVPIMQVGLINPLDEPVVERMLGRCEHVVLLEPRPGSIEGPVFAVSESMRRRGGRPAQIWSRALPPDPTGKEAELAPDDAVTPSILVRRIIHLLHVIRPSLDVPAMLAGDPPALPVRPPPRGMDLGMAGVETLLRSVLADVEQGLRDDAAASGGRVTALSIDGVEPPAAATGRVARVETWSGVAFLAEGVASLRQAALSDGPWIFVVAALRPTGTQDLERLARGAVPGERADRLRIETADLGDRGRLRAVLQEMAQAEGVGVVVAADGPPPRFDLAALRSEQSEIDRLGYEPRQRVVWGAEDPCVIRRPADDSQAGGPAGFPMATELAVGRLPPRSRKHIRLRVRPLLEQIEVVRERPPVPRWRPESTGRLPRPEPIHGRYSQWRAHLAGFRGEPPGVAARVLCDAGRAMGYDVRGVADPTPIGPGRFAWAQILFTRPRREGEPLTISGGIPYGEADLLLGMDCVEALRAIDRDAPLRVASADRTCAVVNVGPLGGEPKPDSLGGPGGLAAAFRAVSRDGYLLLEDFAGACRGAFQTERLVDLALLGTAHQLGLVPLTREAIEASAQRLEDRGFGRAVEAFQLGCHIAADRRLAQRPVEAAAEDLERAVRRALLLLGRRRGAPFADLLRRTIDAAPGLSETDPGRQARRDLVAALERCLAWGGFSYARRYAELVAALYRADRGDTGRALTRDAVLPLAEAMLIRDPLYVATMATSPHHRLRIRRSLNVKHARGDRLERRFLTRIELEALRRRYRLDLRTSDWPAWALALLRRAVPAAWRGSRRQRRIRDHVVGVVEQAARGAVTDYRRWSETMHRLHVQAREDRLRSMAPSELQMLLERPV